jgi:hypothetical protein
MESKNEARPIVTDTKKRLSRSSLTQLLRKLPQWWRRRWWWHWVSTASWNKQTRRRKRKVKIQSTSPDQPENRRQCSQLQSNRPCICPAEEASASQSNLHLYYVLSSFHDQIPSAFSVLAGEMLGQMQKRACHWVWFHGIVEDVQELR